MARFVIERDMPGAGKLSPEELRQASMKSCDVLQKLGPKVQWEHSYVTDNKIFCIYHSADEKLIQQHAQQAGFPANRITRVRTVIDPTTAELR